MKQKSREEIARVAYDLWEKGGHQNGNELENWTAAEEMVKEQNKSECGESKRDGEIRKIAYDVWEKKGKPIGQDFDNWLEAKQIFRRKMRERKFRGWQRMGKAEFSERAAPKSENGNDNVDENPPDEKE